MQSHTPHTYTHTHTYMMHVHTHGALTGLSKTLTHKMHAYARTNTDSCDACIQHGALTDAVTEPYANSPLLTNKHIYV